MLPGSGAGVSMQYGPRTVLLLGFIGAVSTCLAAAPEIRSGGVLNAASYGSGIAQGSFFSIFGTGLGPASGISAQLPYPVLLPASNGTSVTVNSGGNAFHAFITYARASQVNAIMPSNVPAGPATVTVSFSGVTSQPEPINVVQENFGVVTENAQGWGQAAAQFLPLFGKNNITSPANPGQVMILYGTGLGRLPSGSADNEPIPSSAPAVNFLRAP